MFVAIKIPPALQKPRLEHHTSSQNYFCRPLDVTPLNDSARDEKIVGSINMSSENGTGRNAHPEQPDQFSKWRDSSTFGGSREENLNGQSDGEGYTLVDVFKKEFSGDSYRIFERNLNDTDLLDELEEADVLPARDEEELRLLRDLGLRSCFKSSGYRPS